MLRHSDSILSTSSLAVASLFLATLGTTNAKTCGAGTFFSAGSATTDGTCTGCTNGCQAWDTTGGFHKSGGEPTDEIEGLLWDGCAAVCGKRGKKECEYWTYLKAEKLCLMMKDKGDYVDDGQNNYVEGDPCPASTYLVGTYQAKEGHQVEACDAQPTCKTTEYLADFNVEREGTCTPRTPCGQGERLQFCGGAFQRFDCPDGNGVVTAGECVDCSAMQFQEAEAHFEPECYDQPTCNDNWYLANHSSTQNGTCTLKRTACGPGLKLREGNNHEKLKDDTTCNECDDGDFKNGTDGRTQCRPKRGGCPEGHYFVAGKDEVKIKDDTECKACPAKTYKRGENDRGACIAKIGTCPPGEYLDPGDDANVVHDDAQCLLCPAGTHKIKEGVDACQPKVAACGPGLELDPGYDRVTHKDDSSCNACDDGEFKGGTNADKCQDKKKCRRGEFLAGDDAGSAASDRVCEVCPHGTYMGSRTHLATECDPQTICQPGYYLRGASSSKRGSCRACPGGTFTSLVPHYDEECLSQPTCGRGFFYTSNPDGGQGTCEACPAGTYMRDLQHRIGRCKADDGCSAGHRYVAAEMRDEPNACSLCEDETFTSGYNHYQTSCTKQPTCGAGQFEVPYSASLSSRRQCKGVAECAEGLYETRAPTATSDRRCATIAECDAGTYVGAQPSATSDRICEDCPKNTYQPDENAESEAACTPVSDCPRGTFLKSAPSAAKDTVCSECPNGQFQDLPDHRMAACTDVRRLLRCERDQYLIPYNATQDSRCEWCPEGTFVDADTHTLEECGPPTTTTVITTTTSTASTTTLHADDVFTMSATPADGSDLGEQPAYAIAALQADLEKQLDDCETIYGSDQSGMVTGAGGKCATQRAAVGAANAAFEAATAREKMATAEDGGGPGVIIAAVVVVLVVVVGAVYFMYAQKVLRKSNGSLDVGVTSFTNPQFNVDSWDNVDGAPEYDEGHAGNGGAGMHQEPTFFDSGGAHVRDDGNAQGSDGYMEVGAIASN